MQINQFDLLKTRRFLPLFLTQFLGAFNDNIFKNALVVLIIYRLAQTGAHAQILVTAAAGIFILPFFLFSATAGQLADKYEKSRLITIFKLAEIILMLVAIKGFYLQNVTLLMGILFFLGSQAAFFGPVKYAILPNALRENELIAGNGLIEAGTFLSILFGTILGGLLILIPGGDYFISATLLIVAIAGFVCSLYIPKTTAANPHLKLNYNIFAETRDVIRYAQQRADIFLAVLGISWFWLVGAVFLAEFPVFVKTELFAQESVVTYFIALFSLGIGAGSLLCNRLLQGKVHATYVPLGALGMTIFTIHLYYGVMPLNETPQTLMTFGYFISSWQGIRISLDLLLIAICGGLYTVPLYAFLQKYSDDAHRARIIASNNIINALFMTVAALFTAVLLKINFSVSQVFLLIGMLNGVVAIYICKLLPDLLVRTFFHWLLKSIYRVEVTGIENYHAAGERVVIVANHTSFLDALLLAIFLPDKLTFAVDTYTAQKKWIKFFLRMVDTYSINPTNPMALKSLIDFVKQDKKCVIFPEGRLTVTGALMKIYEGPGLIADKAEAKLLPIRIQGAQYTPFSRLWGKVRIRFAPKITLTIFPAQSLDIAAELKGRARRQKIGNRLYDLMTEAIFESSDYQQTLFSALIEAKKTHGRRHKIVEDIERVPLNYQQLITRCFILGNIIAKQTAVGELVGVLLPNMVGTSITFFALQAYCRIPAMLNFSAGAMSVVIACQTAKIKTVYTSQKFIDLANLQEMVAALKNAGINVIPLESLRAKVNIFIKLKGSLMGLFPQFSYQWINRQELAQPLLNGDAAAVVLFTSGSEGTPKGVVLAHKNIQANRFQLSSCVDFTTNDRILNVLPVFHAFGLTGGMILPMLSGVQVFFYPSPLHYRIVPQLAYDINATILFGTDTFLSGYAKYAHQYDFYSIRYIFAGAEKLRHETRTTWAQKFGVQIFEGYGATETAPVLATNTPMHNKVGTVGRLLPSIRYQIKPVPGIAEGGVLMVSGPNVMKGYLHADNPGVLVPPLEGWYETGDIVTVDETGYVTILGRVKRFAKIAGEMVSLTMVEQQINALWPDHHHAVVSMPDPKKGEQLILVTTFQDATRDAIVAHAKTHRMSEIAIPKKIIIQETLPLLGSGKIDYTGVKDVVTELVVVGV